MNVLIVLNCCYPSSGTGTNLVNKLLFDGKLIDSFDSVTILCGKESLYDKDIDTYNGMKIIRTSSNTLLPKKELGILREKSFFHYVVACLEKAAFHIEDKLFSNSFSDRYAVHSFYNALKKLNDKYDVVISMSGRYYNSIATAKYCKEKGIPFIFYQVDPCASNQYLSKRSLNLRKKIEQYIYSVATYILTTELIANDIKEYMSIDLQNKVRTMEFPLVTDNTGVPSNNNIPVCVFTGSIYGGIRNPNYTIKLFQPLINRGIVELHFAGMNEDELENSKGVICHGVLPINDAEKLNRNADYLVNIGNSVTNQVPSKLFDYISTGKPIINICKNHECPTIKYLEKYQYSINLFEDERLLSKQIEALSNFIHENNKKRLSFNIIQDNYYNCTPKYCSDEIRKILDEVINTNKNIDGN